MMRGSMQEYYRTITGIYSDIVTSPANDLAFQSAGKAIAQRLAQDHLIYLVGPGGHSNMATEECMCRAGMPVQLSPMIDATNLLHGTTKTRFLQRSGAYAKGLLEEYGIGRGDVLVVVNAYGINFLSVELALQARELGATVVGICSTEFGRRIPPDHPARHPSGQNLFEVCDIFLDNKMPYGDAVIHIEGAEQQAGPTSTLCNVFTIDMLMISAVEELIEMGAKPDLWRSINLPGGDAYNQRYFRDYGQRIRYLL